MRFAEDGRLDRDEWTTLLDFYDASQISNYVSTDGTYNEMLSAGRLDLLGDGSLKSDLSDYYVSVRSNAHVLFETLPAYREDIRGAVPYRFQRYILERCKSNAWEAFRTTALRMERSGIGALAPGEIPAFAAQYREVAADLARARTYQVDPRVITYLERVVTAGHNALYRARGKERTPLLYYILRDFSLASDGDFSRANLIQRAVSRLLPLI